MRAGNLDRVIVIESKTTEVDYRGTPEDTWTPFATMRAQVLQFSTDDREGARGLTTDTTITFRIRWRDGVTLEHRVAYDGKHYTIRQIKEIGRRVGLDIVCERAGQ